jgi:hypothetical protein
MRSLILSVVLGCVVAAHTAHATPPPACHEITVLYEGRQHVFSSDGLDFYRWHYTVMGGSCINRALSFWTIDICPDWLPYITDVSSYCLDASDSACGEATLYRVVIGTDPHTGITGIKWEQVGGNELDRPGEYDTFSFICPGLEDPSATVVWASKGGQLFDGGTAVRPGCIVIPTDKTSWGKLKSLYR